MKASRAPGPITYSQRHQKDKRLQRDATSNKTPSIVTPNNGERLIRHKEIDLTRDCNEWASMDSNLFQDHACELKNNEYESNSSLSWNECMSNDNATHNSRQYIYDNNDRQARSAKVRSAEDHVHSRCVVGLATAPAGSNGQQRWEENDFKSENADMETANFSDDDDDSTTNVNYSQPNSSLAPEIITTSKPKSKDVFYDNPPPLPCEAGNIAKITKQLTDEEKLYYTRKPRSVDFKYGFRSSFSFSISFFLFLASGAIVILLFLLLLLVALTLLLYSLDLTH